MLKFDKSALIYTCDGETLRVEPWGENAFRIRAVKQAAFPQENWALTEPHPADAQCELTDSGASIANGKLTVTVSNRGKLTARNADGKLLLEEFCRNRRDVTDPKCSALEVEAREFRPIPGGDWRLTARFESLDPDERLYGMGQYQQPYLNLKGTDLELAQRNSQASVPFVLSSLGYGLLWNNPAVGRAVFGKNQTSFEAYSTDALDYWLVCGDTPMEILRAYSAVTGTVPMMPKYGLGFWQCKLRYRTQEELLNVAREYRRRGIPLDVIVIDFFHWPLQGDWKFDPDYFPDPDAMIAELNEMGVELMVSVWPTVDRRSENFAEMAEKGYLIRSERGVQIAFDFMGNSRIFDATNPDARKFVWDKVKKNYYDKGIHIFWLDEAEPEYAVYDFDNYRYWRGPDLKIGNIYPSDYARGFYEGMREAGQENVVNLLRCAWAGSQKYGALVWSGDIASSFSSMRNQLAAGLNMAIAGIPWWTTDIGGFHGGNPDDESFRELFVRWFQWGAFCPVMRLHGDREPKKPQLGVTGGAECLSGADNEVWSYGEKVYEICKKYIGIRQEMRDYTRELMRQAHEDGTPVMRALFLEFPDDHDAWRVEDEYLYGPDYLVAPVLEAGARKRSVYLPAGCRWKNTETGLVYDCTSGGRRITADCPLESMPVFRREV